MPAATNDSPMPDTLPPAAALLPAQRRMPDNRRPVRWLADRKTTEVD